MDVDYIFLIDLLGVLAFAISGVLTAMKKHLDPFGILIIAFATAIGGGTLRDILIGVPVAWIQNITYVYVIIGTTIMAIIFRNKLVLFRRSIFLFDTIGISLYTLIGIEKALEAGFSPPICIATGTMTACFGGVLRDILSNDIPVIFHKEIYATACILGGVIYFVLLETPLAHSWIFIISGVVVFLVRSLAVYFNLQLPTVYTDSNPGSETKD